MSHAADRNLLFGILALQMDFVTRDQLVAAMHAWVLDKSKSLGKVLVEQGALAQVNHDLLAPLVQAHIQQHNNDPQQSLAAVSAADSARQLLQQIGDADVQASLVHVRAGDSTSAYVGPGTLPPHARFQILRPHAKGGLGEVFVAQDAELDREVALKEIQERHAGHPDNRARFLLEAKVTGGLEHPGIVPVYGLGNYADGRPFYAMRFIKGDSLKDAISRFHKQSNADYADYRREKTARDSVCDDPRNLRLNFVSLEFRQLLGRFVDVCNAIAYAHSRGVLHRDLKPGNIMLGKYGETLVVDWGLAKVLGKAEPETSEGALVSSGDSGLTQAGHALGTPAFMSPEQATGKLDQLGPKSDVYSLGATLFCLLTGRAPFVDADAGAVLGKVQKGDFPSPRQLGGNAVPAALDAICLKAMSLKPADRYATPLSLAEDIEHYLADEPVSAYREPWPKRLARWRRRHNTLVTAAALVLLTLLIGGGLGLGVLERQKAEARTLGQVDALADASASAVPALLAELASDPVAAFARTRVREKWNDATLTDRQRLRIGLALAAEDADVRTRLIDLAQKADDPHEVLLVRDALKTSEVSKTSEVLWTRSRDAALPRVERLRLWAILATLDAQGAGWKDAAEPALDELFIANPRHLGVWQQAFAPVRQALLPALKKAYRDPAESRRQLAAALLADYAANDPEVLAELLLDADAKQFGVVFAAAAKEKNQSGGKAQQSKWLAELDKKPAPPQAGKEVLKKEGTIAADDPAVKTAGGKAMPAHVFEIVLKAGTAYKISMTSKEIDPYVVVQDSAGKELGSDDDSGGGLNSLLEFTPAKTEMHKVYTAALQGTPGAKNTGAFVLTITEAAAAGPKENLASRQANAAVALLRLGQADKVWPLLKHTPDPSVRSYLIHRFGPQGVDWEVIVKRFEEEKDVSARRALLLSLGEYHEPRTLVSGGGGAAKPLTNVRGSLTSKLLDLYRNDPDAGLHGAAGWLLTHWGHKDKLLAMDRELATVDPFTKNQSGGKAPHSKAPTWWVNSQGQTMIAIPGPVEFLMGAPARDPDRQSSETQHLRRINRSFALAAHPVTVEQFLKYRQNYNYRRKHAPTPDCPAHAVTWYEAAGYCNWLSGQEKIPQDEWCYETNSAGQVVKLKEKYLSLPGYRLPTEAETEYACRALAATSRYYGDQEELLGKYAWFNKNSEDRSWPVGLLKPNDFGLFDMQGNIFNWCQETYQPYPLSKDGKAIEDIEDRLSITNQDNRVLRAGSFNDQAGLVRSSPRIKIAPTTRIITVGFRPSRTLPF